jgi:hypothetical protein
LGKSGDLEFLGVFLMPEVSVFVFEMDIFVFEMGDLLICLIEGCFE